MADAVLELRQVTKSYPGSPPIEVLKGIDLAITEGELVAIVGPSGSGKSTLLNMMGALDRPSTGEVLIDGTVVNGLRDPALSGVRGRRLGFVFQQFHLLPGLSATARGRDLGRRDQCPRGDHGMTQHAMTQDAGTQTP